MRESFPRQGGDTLVEVLISLAILSLIIVGGNALMNFGLSQALTAVEHTQVRNRIVGQAELLRYLRDNADAGSGSPVSQAWYDRVLGATDYVSDDGSASPIEACTPQDTAFYLTANLDDGDNKTDIQVHTYDAASPPPNDTPSAVPGDGIWIEGVSHPSADVPYVNFHIRACWQGAGTSVDQRSSTVLRLYAPGVTP